MTAATSSGKRPASLLFFLVWFCIRVWAVCSCTILITHGLSQLHAGWTDGAGHPFCEDFLNLWSAGFLLLHHHLMVAYNFEAFHHFQIGIVHHAINLYHYSYPPVSALLSIPFGLLPYPLACVLWQGGGWLAFALVLRRITPKHWCLLALAWPAVFVNTLSGQTGCWIAAIIGYALLDLRDNQTIRAGLLLSLLVAKPQLGWIVPLALLSGREWKALFTMAVGSVGLLALSIMVAGIQPWFAWHERLSILRRIILEDGSGVMQRMMEVGEAPLGHLAADDVGVRIGPSCGCKRRYGMADAGGGNSTQCRSTHAGLEQDACWPDILSGQGIRSRPRHSDSIAVCQRL